MNYDYFERDFVERTLENLRVAKDVPNDVTNVLNSCLGLIVYPKEFDGRVLIDWEKFKHGEYGKITCIATEEDQQKNLLRCMRNAIAHGRIEQTGQKDGRITELSFISGDENHSPQMIITMTIPQLSNFAEDIANTYISTINNKNLKR